MTGKLKTLRQRVGSIGSRFATQAHEGKERDRQRRQANEWRAWYASARWRDLRTKALKRDMFTCQRCGCLLVTTNRHHPHAAVVNHKTPHRGNAKLFFDLKNLEAVCKTDHDALIQREEARGYAIGSGLDGMPVDPNHPWNRGTTG